MYRSPSRISGVLSLTLALAATAQAQGQRDFGAMKVETQKVADNLYMLDGVGGRIGVLVGPDGVFMVDAGYEQVTDKVVAAVKAISDGHIRLLANTHLHPDHTGGDAAFAKMGVIIIARDELRARLAAAPNAVPAGLPMETYEGHVRLHMNGEEPELIPVPRAHTDGDTMVWFPRGDVLMTGDFYRSAGYPYIDRDNGGSLAGMLAGLAQVVAMTGPATKIAPGHGAIVNRAAVQAHRDMVLAIRDRIAALIAQGKTADEVVAARPTAAYDATVPMGSTTSERFIRQVYADLKGA